MNNYNGYNPFNFGVGQTFNQFGNNYPQQMVSPNISQINQPNAQYQQQSTNDIPIQGVKFVTGDEAKAFIVMPNTRVLLMDKSNSIFYIKSADSLGQSTTETFRFEKVENNSLAGEKEKEQINLTEYAKKDDLSNLVTNDRLSEVETKLSKKLEELQKSINIKKYLEGESKDV